MSDFQPIILKNITDLHNIEVYMKNGGLSAF